MRSSRSSATGGRPPEAPPHFGYTGSIASASSFQGMVRSRSSRNFARRVALPNFSKSPRVCYFIGPALRIPMFHQIGRVHQSFPSAGSTRTVFTNAATSPRDKPGRMTGATISDRDSVERGPEDRRGV
jgi:hypothetical protein